MARQRDFHIISTKKENQGNSAKNDKKKDWESIRELIDQFIVTKMIDTKGLEHAEKSMTEMDCQNYEGYQIKNSIEGLTEFDRH